MHTTTTTAVPVLDPASPVPVLIIAGLVLVILALIALGIILDRRRSSKGRRAAVQRPRTRSTYQPVDQHAIDEHAVDEQVVGPELDKDQPTADEGAGSVTSAGAAFPTRRSLRR